MSLRDTSILELDAKICETTRETLVTNRVEDVTNESEYIAGKLYIKIICKHYANSVITKYIYYPYSEDLVKYESTYVDGLLSNKIRWDHSGEKAMEMNNCNIVWYDWYANGTKHLEKIRSRGGDFIQTEWFRNGNIFELRKYGNSYPCATSQQWYENGDKRSEKTYTDGKITEIKYWTDDNGVQMYCDDIDDKTYDSDQDLEDPQDLDDIADDYFDEVKHNSSTIECNYFDPEFKHEPVLIFQRNNGKYNGKLVSGKQDGVWSTYYASGIYKSRGNFKDGKMHGLWTFWNEEGIKQNEIMYSIHD